LANITLPNGDEVGVMEPWQYPDSAGPPSPERAAAEKAAEDLFLTLLARFTLRNHLVGSKAGPNHAPSLFAKEPDAKEARLGKSQFEAAMSRLFKARKIDTRAHQTPDRKTRFYIEAV